MKLSTYFIVYVVDMDRAVAFYKAIGADVGFESPHWTSTVLGGVAVGLHPGAAGSTRDIGLGIDADDLDELCSTIEAAGGHIVERPIEKPGEGITIGRAQDTEGNVFTITLANH
jgi:predicted enzyme related to lactoylglutathione lyase